MTAQSIQETHRIDGRTFAAKRRGALIRNFVDALGGDGHVSALQLVNIRRAAELAALAEEARTRALRAGSDAVDLSGLIRLEGMAARAQKALGLGTGGKKAAEPVTDLQAYLASKSSGGAP